MRLRRYFRYQYVKILRLKDSPAKIAKGVALGVALDFLPLPFISILVAWIIAKLVRINTIAAVMTTAALKPAVFTIFFPFNYLIGEIILENKTQLSLDHQVPVLEPSLTLDSLRAFFSMDNLQILGPPFFVGSLINAVVWGTLVYCFLHRTLVYRQQRKLSRLK